jgi:condensin complex subunit 2
LKKASEKNNLLPPDVHYDIKMLTQLFNKPKWRVSLVRKFQEISLIVLQNKRKRDEPSEDDSVHFAPEMHPTEMDDDDHEYVIEPPVEVAEAGLELIAEPRKVEQIKISYAKTAKFVDVKALKEDIWRELKEHEKEEDKRGQKFAAVLETLPEKVPAEALSNVSVPFCFICLLHLANEKGLFIDQKKGDLGELFIHTK